jgi:catechol 2,3-dioxygenase-like lactoylglutathione lyase family enzyme
MASSREESQTVHAVLRIARPVTDLQRAEAMYANGLGLRVLSRFEDHDGFDGVMLGAPGAAYHFEFTRHRGVPVLPAPTPEDLAVLYLPDEGEWREACARMRNAGFREVASFNPYWDRHGRTFEDADGYRTVLWNGSWAPRPREA